MKVMYRTTNGFYLAYCDALPGLLVAGRSLEDIKSRLPGQIRELLTAIDLHDFDFQRDDAEMTTNKGV